MNKYFVSDPDQPRARRTADVAGVVSGLLLVLLTGLTADRVSAGEEALVGLTKSFPSWFDGLYKLGYLFSALFVVGLFIGVVAQGRKRLDLLRDMVLAFAGSLGLAILLGWWVESSFPALLPEFSTAEGEPAFPVLRLATVTSVIAVAAPHLARPLRRSGWAFVVIVAISALGLGLGLPGDALGGIGLGLAAAGIVLLVFGSPRGYPNVAGITAALADLDLEVRDLAVAPDQSWGVRRLSGVLEDGRPMDVKAYGRDATDSRFFRNAWRTVWYRGEGRQFTFTRLAGVEHEALAMLMAQKSGVEVPEVLAVGVGGDDVALLATTARGEPVRDVHLTHDTLVTLWLQVERLHADKMAHRALRLNAVTVDSATGPSRIRRCFLQRVARSPKPRCRIASVRNVAPGRCRGICSRGTLGNRGRATR